jgi:hypothetical protein
MKKTLLSIALAVVAPLAWGQTSSTTTTTTTTESDGTITEYTPGSMITLKETSGPRHYRFGKTVTYVTKSGKVLDEATVKTRVRVGVPVHVHYTGEGDNVIVDRVIVDED